MARTLTPGSFHGEKLRSVEVAGFRLSEWTYQPAVKFTRHAHAWPYLNLVIQGTYTKIDKGNSQTYTPLTLAFHPAGELHEDQFHDEGGRIFDLVPAPQWLERIRGHGVDLDRPSEFPSGPPVWLALRLYDEFRHMDDVSPLAIEGLTLELLAEVSRQPAVVGERQPPRWLRQVGDLLQDRFAEGLSLDEIGAAVGVHPDHVARVFRRHYRCTIGDHVRQLRITFACRQLTTTDLPLVEIASAAGFADQSHLTNTFKRRMGVTPAQFRGRFATCRLDTIK